MEPNSLLFYINIIISFTLTAYILLIKSILQVLISFFLLILNLAFMYIIIGSSFLAVTYLIIYLSATLILLIAGIMQNKVIFNASNKRFNIKNVNKSLSMAISIIFFIIANVVNSSVIYNKLDSTKITFNDIKIEIIGLELMTKHIIPFEMISLLLLATLIGIIIKLK